MKPSVVLFAVLLGGCGSAVSRPGQDNFTINASKQQAQAFVQNIARRFDAPLDAHDLAGLGDDPTRLFRLDGAKATLVMVPLPDGRCNPKAPLRSTFNHGEYRVDLVYRSDSEAARMASRRVLSQSAQDEGLTVKSFEDC